MMVGGEEEDDIGAEQNIGKQQINPALYSAYNLLGQWDILAGTLLFLQTNLENWQIARLIIFNNPLVAQ